MTQTTTRTKQREFTYALAWRGLPPPTLLPHVTSTGTTFLYTDKSFLAWGAAYLTSLECGGHVDMNEWPIGIAPRWLQEHACLTDLFDRLVGTQDRNRVVYAPVFDRNQELVLAVLWNLDERFVAPPRFGGVTNLSGPNSPFSGAMMMNPPPLAAHTAQPTRLPPYRVATAEGSGELLD